MARKNAIDHRTLSGKPVKDDIPSRWWTLPPDEAASATSGIIALLREHQSRRVEQYVRSARFYGNAPLFGIYGVPWSKLSASQGQFNDRLTFNIIQSVVDTTAAKIAAERPKPYYLTDGGNFKLQRAAKKLNDLVEGTFFETRLHEKAVRAFTDAAVFGDGILHVYEDHGRVACDRVSASELFADEVEGHFGQVRQLHRAKHVDRWKLVELFPEKRDVILDAAVQLDEVQSGRQNIADLVTVTESWHLPSAPGAKDGAHIICIGDRALTDVEPWTHDWFPFARLSWTPRLFGFWGQGLVEQLQGIQLEINGLLAVIQRSFRLAGTFKVILPIGSKIPRTQVNNEIGTIIYAPPGGEPKYILPPVVPAELYVQLERLVQKAYEIPGVSMMAATAEKPAGLNSGAALRSFSDISSARFAIHHQDWEAFHVEVARQMVATIRDISRGSENRRKAYKVSVPRARYVSRVDWREIDIDENSDAVRLQCYPISSLPKDPAGRWQQISEWVQAGWYTPRQGRRLMSLPDLEAQESLSDAAEDWLLKILDQMVDDGVYTAPEPYDDLELAAELSRWYYQRAKVGGLEEERLQLLRDFMADVEALKAKLQPQPAPAGVGQPLAPPMPLAPSELVQNVPNAA